MVDADLGAEGHDAVEVAPALRVPEGDPEQHVRPVRARLVRELGEEALHAVGEGGHRGLRPHHEVRVPVGAGEGQVVGHARGTLLVAPLEVLGDVALDDGDAARRAARPGPLHVPQPPAEAPQGCQGGARRDPSRDGDAAPHEREEQSRTQRDGPPDPVDAEHRSEPTERRPDLAVAHLQPGETGEEPAPDPLHQDPGGRQQGERPPAPRQPPPQARLEIPQGGRVEGHERHEGDGEGERRRRRDLAEGETLPNPGGPDAEEPQTEEPSAPRSHPRTLGGEPQAEQASQQQGCQGGEPPGGEGERQGRPEGAGKQVEEAPAGAALRACAQGCGP